MSLRSWVSIGTIQEKSQSSTIFNRDKKKYKCCTQQRAHAQYLKVTKLYFVICFNLKMISENPTEGD